MLNTTKKARRRILYVITPSFNANPRASQNGSWVVRRDLPTGKIIRRYPSRGLRRCTAWVENRGGEMMVEKSRSAMRGE